MKLPLLSCLLILSISSAPAAPVFSELWGQHGEKWSERGPLPDFSRAGYHQGNDAIPAVERATNVKDFGAIGDGVADDTKAIQAAIDATKRGAVFIPAGRYLISDILRIAKPGIVLRGAGASQTLLWFPRGLDEIHPREQYESRGLRTSGYSFFGGLISIEGDYQAKPLTPITALARRGDTEIVVADPGKLSVGSRVLLVQHETADQTLKTFLYNDDPGDIRKGKAMDNRIVVRVVAIAGNRVRLDRPIRCDTRAEWRPELLTFNPSVSECGVEEIGCVFPPTRYRGHFQENGANAIELRHVADCWVRNVTVHNGDLGINIAGCFNTVDGVVITADDKERGRRDAGVAACTGHHGIDVSNSEDNLITHFDFRTTYIHDLSVEHSSGNVFSAGRGVNLDFDHHKDTPYENLFTDIDCGAGERVWRCGGGASIGRQSAGWATFWNIRASRPPGLPPVGWGPKTMVFVAVDSGLGNPDKAAGPWVEEFDARSITPRDLHAAQLERRLGKPTASTTP